MTERHADLRRHAVGRRYKPERAPPRKSRRPTSYMSSTAPRKSRPLCWEGVYTWSGLFRTFCCLSFHIRPSVVNPTLRHTHLPAPSRLSVAPLMYSQFQDKYTVCLVTHITPLYAIDALLATLCVTRCRTRDAMKTDKGKNILAISVPRARCAHRITLLGTELHEHTGNSLSGRRTAPKGCTVSNLSVSLEVGVDAHSIMTLKSTRSRERRRRSWLMDQHGNSRGSGRKF